MSNDPVVHEEEFGPYTVLRKYRNGGVVIHSQYHYRSHPFSNGAVIEEAENYMCDYMRAVQKARELLNDPI